MSVKLEQRKSSFGDWLRERRTAKGLGVRELAGLTDGECSASYISYLERNVYSGREGNPTRPSEAIVEALAKGLEVPFNEARFAAGYTKIASATSESEVLEAFPTLTTGYGLLSQQGKTVAKNQVDTMIRGLMEMEGVTFADEQFTQISSDKLEEESEYFTVDWSHSDQEDDMKSDDDFEFMTDEELKLRGFGGKDKD